MKRASRLGWVDGNAGQVLNQAVGGPDRLGAGDRGHLVILKDLRRCDWRAGHGAGGNRRARSQHARRRRI